MCLASKIKSVFSSSTTEETNDNWQSSPDSDRVDLCVHVHQQWGPNLTPMKWYWHAAAQHWTNLASICTCRYVDAHRYYMLENSEDRMLHISPGTINYCVGRYWPNWHFFAADKKAVSDKSCKVTHWSNSHRKKSSPSNTSSIMRSRPIPKKSYALGTRIQQLMCQATYS
jgi:hypothetical protein